MLTTKEFSEVTGVPVGTLKRWRSKPHSSCEGRQGVLVPAVVDKRGRCFYTDAQIDIARQLHNSHYGQPTLFEEMTHMPTDEAVNPFEIDAHDAANKLFDAAVPDKANAAQVAPHAPNDSDDAEPVTLKQFNAWCSLVQKIRDGQLDNVNRLRRELKDTGIITDRQQLIDLAGGKDCYLSFRLWLAKFNLDFVDDKTGELRKLVPYEDGTCGFENVIDAEEISAVVTLEQRAEKIRRLQANVQRGIIEIGNELIAAKAEIGHGNWAAWLEKEFEWTQRTANNFMRVAERFGKLENVFQFKPSTLQAMLALPTGSEDEFIDAQANAGKPVNEMSAREVQSAVKEFNQQRAPEIGNWKTFSNLKPAIDTNAKLNNVVQFETPPARDDAEPTVDSTNNDGGDVEVVGGECKRSCEGKVAAFDVIGDDDDQCDDAPAQIVATRDEIHALLARVEELILHADDDALTITKAGLAGIVAALEKNRPPLKPTG